MSTAKYLLKRYGIFIYRPTYCGGAAVIRNVVFAALLESVFVELKSHT